MKRRIALCLSLLLLAALSACKKGSDKEQNTIEQEITEQKTEENSEIAENETGSTVNPDAITVSNVAELIKAIAPDSNIILAPGNYNFSKVTEEEIALSSDYVNKEYLKEYESLLISDVTGLTLEASEDGKVELVTENGGASVLEIRKSENVMLRGLTCGHEVEKGTCSGGVLYAEDCKNLTVENCRLYGCGTEGIWTQRVDGLNVKGTEIFECSESVFSFDETGAIFDNCRFHDNYGDYLFYFSDGSDILVMDTEICDNQGYMMLDYSEFGDDTDNRHITFRNCTFKDNSRINRAPVFPYATFVNCEFPNDSVSSAVGTAYEELVERFYNLASDPYSIVDIAEYGEFGVIESARSMEENALAGIGYTIEDLSGDGIPELVVGTLPEYGGQINAVYTLVDDCPEFVFEGWYRSSYSYLGDGRFYYYGSSGASETGQGYYSLSKDGTTLNCEEFYFTHAEREDYSDLKVYYNTTGSWDIKASEESDMTLDMFWDLEPFSSEELSLTSFADYELERGPQAPLQDGSLILREID